MKYSSKREAIYNFLANTTTHPTAEDVYFELKKTMPNIGQATIYRNLRLLSSQKNIALLSVMDGKEHFDGNTKVHAHQICEKCGKIVDIMLNYEQMLLLKQISKDSFQLNYYGICNSCKNINTKTLKGE